MRLGCGGPGTDARMSRQLRDFLDLVKAEHTVFALPFAYLGMVLAGQPWPTWRQALWITVAMIAARTLAMALNRLIDLRLDAANPRTAQRPLVTGKVTPRVAWIGSAAAALLLGLAAWQLGPLPLCLLPGALLFLVGYSFTKRYTWLSHFVLGFTDGLAPMGAWVGVRGSLFTAEDLPAWLLLGIVTFWIVGFDILYACQDAAFDREHGLHAIPARFGIRTALWVSAACHVLTWGGLLALGAVLGLAWPYWVGLLIVGGLLVYEHRLVKPDDLSKLVVAFFNINGYISLILFGATLWARALS